jgi:hypothetical protein
MEEMPIIGEKHITQKPLNQNKMKIILGCLLCGFGGILIGMSIKNIINQKRLETTKKPENQEQCSCDNGIIICPGCEGDKKSEFGICAGCIGVGEVVCGKCNGSGKSNRNTN